MTEPAETSFEHDALVLGLRAHRDELTAVRRLAQVRPTRNVGATQSAIRSRTLRATDLAAYLIAAGDPWRAAVGLAAAETQLVDRIQLAEAEGAPASHVQSLRDRLRSTRRQLREIPGVDHGKRMARAAVATMDPERFARAMHLLERSVLERHNDAGSQA